MTKIRDDLTLAAYAVMLGYNIKTDDDGAAAFNPHTGIPGHSLSFQRGPVTVWYTSRGWRVARIIDGMYERPLDDHFHDKLKVALDVGFELGLPDPMTTYDQYHEEREG